MITHTLPFDPTYGFKHAELEQVTSPAQTALEIEEFAAFWGDYYEKVMAVRASPRLQECESVDSRWRKYEIIFSGWDGFEVGGWLLVPVGVVRQGMVVGHGYGGRDGPDAEAGLLLDTVYLFVCSRGFNLSARKDLSCDCFRHVLTGIESKETYLIGYCVADMWSATSALLEMYPALEGRVGYMGESFGGGLGALAAAWEKRWSKLILNIPTFGNHPMRVGLEMVGSGQAISRYYQRHPEVLEVLRFYDAATAAKYARMPGLFGLALFDPAVPPPGQWSIANNYGGEKTIVVHHAAHFGGYAEERDDQKAWAQGVREMLEK